MFRTAVLILSLLTASSVTAAELRIKMESSCPQTLAPSQGEFAVAGLLIPLGVAVAQKVAGAAIDQAASHLKDDTSVTKTGYYRQSKLVEADNTLSQSVACVYGVIGEFGGRGEVPSAPPLNAFTKNKLREMGLKGEPLVYFEGFFLAPEKGSATGVFYFKPRLLYYREHVKSGGLFGSGKRDLGFTIDFVRPNEASAFISTTVLLDALAPDGERLIGEEFFASRQTPWLALPDKDTPFTVKVTFIETGKPDVLDKALGEALADKKGDIVKAIGDALTPKPPDTGEVKPK